MSNVFSLIINRCTYALESIKNRYPCKIVSMKFSNDFSSPTEIQYFAATKTNIRKSTIQEVLNDPLLIEKFHPTDGVKLGFISFGEIILKESLSIDEAREKYTFLIESMMQEENNQR